MADWNTTVFIEAEQDHTTAFHDSGVDPSYDLRAERVAIKSITFALAIGALYILASQVAYCILACAIRKEKSENHTHIRTLNVLCVFAAFTCFLRFGIPMEYLIGHTTDAQCHAVVEYRIITFGVGLATLYTILWIRQRVFYWSPALQDLSTPVIKFLSVATPFIIWPGCVGSIIIVNYAEHYYGTEFGCAIKRTTLNSFAWGFRGVSFFLMQCNLLSLLIYPLLEHRKAMRRGITTDTSAIDLLVKRALVTTVVCVVMDTFTSVLGLAYIRDLALVHLFAYDINLLADLVAVIFSFKNWRERLSPWKELKDGVISNRGVQELRNSITPENESC